MALIQNLGPEDTKELQLMKQRGEVFVAPKQKDELFKKGEEAINVLSGSKTILTPEQSQQYYDLATAIGALGITNNDSRLANIAVQMQKLLDDKFPIAK